MLLYGHLRKPILVLDYLYSERKKKKKDHHCTSCQTFERVNSNIIDVGCLVVISVYQIKSLLCSSVPTVRSYPCCQSLL